MPCRGKQIPKPCRSYFSSLEVLLLLLMKFWSGSMKKKTQKDDKHSRDWKKTDNKWSYSHTLISAPVRLKWTSPGQRVYCSGVSLSLCVSFPTPPPPSNNKQRSLYFSSLFKFTHFSRPFAAPNMPCFPYFWNVKCATCWHCAWMINMSVYNYNRKPQTPTIPPWCWQKMVWMLYRFRGFVVVVFSVNLLLSSNDSSVFRCT